MEIENIQNAVEQNPTSAEQETQQENVSGTDTAAAPQEQNAPDNNSATGQQNDGAAVDDNAAGNAADDSPFLTVRYNHEDRHFTREEAEVYARHGLYYEGLYNKLDYIAAQTGIDVNSLVDNLGKQMEDAYRQGLVDKFGEDTETIEELMTVFRNKQKEKYEKTVSERTAQEETKMSDRLSDEYLELKNLIGDTVPAYEELPVSVKKNAAEGMNLTTAFLLYERNEQIKIAAAQASAEAAANASAGSMKSDPVNDGGFLAGLWGK